MKSAVCRSKLHSPWSDVTHLCLFAVLESARTRSVYAMSERVRQMQDLGPDQDRGLYEAVTGFAAQLNMLGPEAVHYQVGVRFGEIIKVLYHASWTSRVSRFSVLSILTQISLRRMLAAIAKDCHTPGNLASVLQKADTELREAMVEGPHRLPRLEKQIRRAVEVNFKVCPALCELL